MKSQFIFNQRDDEYRSMKPELSQSVLKAVLTKSPAHARYALDHPSESTPAQRLGTAAHVRILEGAEAFSGRYAVAPPCDRRTKDGKALFAEFEAGLNGREIITADDFATIEGMAGAIEAHQLAGRLFRGGVAEASAFGKINGIDIKGRFDYFHQTDGVIVDFKTTLDASPDEAQRYAVRYGLHIQQYIYSEIHRSITGKLPSDFVFVLAEKNPPYGVAVVRLTKAAVDAARGEVERALDIWRQCVRAKTWQGYADGVIEVDLPAWKYNKLEVAA